MGSILSYCFLCATASLRWISLSDDLECVDEFEVDAEGHRVVVEVLILVADILQGARILAVASVDKAYVLPFVELGIATWTLLFHGFFKSESILIHREHTCVAHRLVEHFGLLHHELQLDVADGLSIHKKFASSFSDSTSLSGGYQRMTMRNYGDVRGEKKKESFGSFLSFWVVIINGLAFVTQSGMKCSEESRVHPQRYLYQINSSMDSFIFFGGISPNF